MAPERTNARLHLRVECGPSIGIGHLARGRAIAEAAVAAGLSVTYHLPGTAPALVQAGAPGEIELLRSGWTDGIEAGDLVLFDGYGIGAAERDAARERGATVAMIEDHASFAGAVDLLVVPSRSRCGAPHARRVCCGPAYAPIRAAVVAARRAPRGGQHRLVVTMGGADPFGVTPLVLRLLAKISAFDSVVVLIGPLAPVPPRHLLAALERRCPVEVVVAPPEPAALFATCDAAVTAAGSTCFELACLGVPMAMVTVSENQEGIAEILRESAAALDLGSPTELGTRLAPVLGALAKADVQRGLARNGHDLVDGRGASRIVEVLLAQVEAGR